MTLMAYMMSMSLLECPILVYVRGPTDSDYKETLLGIHNL
jgi:hypothetical protein